MITTIKGRLRLHRLSLTIVIICAVIAQGASSFAESSADDSLINALNLDALIKEALANNPQLLALKKKYDASRARLPQAKSLDEPMLGLEVEQVPAGGLRLNKADMRMYSVSQMIPFPGKLSAKGKVALAESQMAAAEYKDKETELIKEVKTAYYDLYMKQKEVELIGALRDVLAQAAKVAETKYIFGKAEQMDVLKAQAELAQLANKLLSVTQEKEAVQVRINALLNRDVHTAVLNVGKIEQSEFIYGLDDLYIIALERKPELAMFRYAIDRSDADYSLAKKSFLPDLTSMFTLRDPRMGAFGAYDILMAINVPIWAWTKQRYAVKEALANLEGAKAAYKAIENATLSEVKELYVKAQNTKRAAGLYKTTILPLADATLMASLAGYQADKTEFLMVLDNMKMVYDNKMEYYKALVEFEQTVADLERAVGRLL